MIPHNTRFSYEFLTDIIVHLKPIKLYYITICGMIINCTRALRMHNTSHYDLFKIYWNISKYIHITEKSIKRLQLRIAKYPFTLKWVIK